MNSYHYDLTSYYCEVKTNYCEPFSHFYCLTVNYCKSFSHYYGLTVNYRGVILNLCGGESCNGEEISCRAARVEYNYGSPSRG